MSKSIRSHGLRTTLLLLSISCGGEVRQRDSGHQVVTQEAKRLTVSDTSPLLSITGCNASTSVLCIQDTAIVPEDPDMADPIAGARWVLFGAKGDSVQISARPHVRTPHGEGAYISSNLGQEHTALGNTAPYLRRRVQSNGLIFLHVSFSDHVDGELLHDTVKYTLRVRREKPDQPASLRAIGEHAILALESARSAGDEFSLIPISLATGVTDFTPWRISAGVYRVLLVSDSLYQLCRLPCDRPDTVKLTPWVRVTKEYK